MANIMKKTCDKYWGNMDSLSMVLIIAHVASDIQIKIHELA